MRTFLCQCGNRVYFESVRCEACGRALGFLPDTLTLHALEPDAQGGWQTLPEGRQCRSCANAVQYEVCNWLVPAEDPVALCRACRLNRIIPDLSVPGHQDYWQRIESAKRRVLYTLLDLGLPVQSLEEDPQQGLAFRFLADANAGSEFMEPVPGQPPVYTGHDLGVITLNLAEADDVARTRVRERLGERYRTLVGHFRHETGHYYWERLVNGTPRLAAFRKRFGDERLDYSQALQSHYNNGPPPDWQQHCVSAYAASHPWEDWAETWAHYLHMVDTLDTARDYALSVRGSPIASRDESRDFERLLEDWVRLGLLVNSLNRSLGMEDPYPFVLTDTVKEKLRFVHEVAAAPSATSGTGA